MLTVRGRATRARGAARVALACAVAWGLAACSEPSPLAPGATPTAQEAALAQLAAAFADGDCATVLARAPGVVASTDQRLHAVSSWYGRCQYRQGDYQGAAASLDALAAQPGDDPYLADAAYYAARARYRLGLYEPAREGFDAFVDRFPYDTLRDDAWYFAGRASMYLGDAQGARGRFDALLGWPGSSPSRRAGALYQRARVDQTEARAATPERSGALFDAAWEGFGRVLDDYPASPYADGAAWHRGLVRYDQGLYDEARALFAAVPEDFPGTTLADDAAYFVARCDERLGRLEQALAEYAQAEALDPAGLYADNARYRAGRVLYAQARAADQLADPGAPALYAQAQAAFEGFLATYPTSALGPAASYFLGRARYAQRLLSAAIEAFAATVAATGSVYRDNALYFTGRAWYRTAWSGDPSLYETAIPWFDRLLSEYPTSFYAAGATYFRARALLALGRPDEAEPPLAGFRDRFPTSSYVDNALYALVLARVALGDCQGADEALTQLQGVTPASPFLGRAQAAAAGCLP